MGDDSIPVYLLCIGGSVNPSTLEGVRRAVRDAAGRVDLDGEFVITTTEVEAIDKDDLIEELETVDDEQ